MTRYFRLRGVLIVLITLYGALLRVEGLAGTYGWMDRPRWAAVMEERVARIARRLSPWGDWPSRPGYEGDPVAYLEFARGMRNFYQGSVREPVFPALTRLWLRILDNKDIAVSYASMTAGILAIPATYLLGSLWSPAVGLLASLALAIELDAVRWSVYGWRDDTFMLFVALSAWAFIRLDRRPTLAAGAIAGLVAAGACLTRLSALSFILPALTWIGVRHAFADAAAAEPRGSRRSPFAKAAWDKPVIAAFVTMALLVAPYLFNSWRETGDPFLAVNFHTRYYQDRDRRPIDTSQGAIGFVGAHLRQRPLRTTDTAVTGLFVFPMRIKWGGFQPWSRWLGGLLFWLAVAGQIAALWTPQGRLLLLILYSSLIPYAITWRIGGGGEWRFSQHAYPIYLVAAFAFVDSAVRRIISWRRHGFADPQPAARRHWRLAAAAAMLTALLLGGRWASPFLVARESLTSGEPATIAAGDRDDAFFSGSWSAPQPAGVITVRAAMAERVAMRLPLPDSRNYQLVVRLDPAETADPASQPTVDLFLNGKTIAQLRLTREPGRIGVYRVPVPRALAREMSRLDFVASHVVAVADAGPNFAWLPRDAKVAFRLWYVRVEPA